MLLIDHIMHEFRTICLYLLRFGIGVNFAAFSISALAFSLRGAPPDVNIRLVGISVLGTFVLVVK